MLTHLPSLASRTGAMLVIAGTVFFPLCPPGLAHADPATDAPAPAAGEREQAQRERLRRIVETRLERIRAEESRLEATLIAIDAGQPLSELSVPEPERRDESRAHPRSDRPDPDRQRGETAGEEQFTDEQIRAFIAEIYPEWIEHMERLGERDPEAVERILQDRRHRLVELMIERRDRPAVFEARQKITKAEMRLRRVAWSFARADEPQERAEAEERVDRMLAEQFDLRLDLSRAELAEAQARADEIRSQLQQAIEHRDRLIAERKADLLRAIQERRSGPPRRDGRSDRGERPDRP